MIFFGNFFDLAHDILERLIQAMGISWSEWFKHPTLAFPIRHAEGDFRAPLRAGETYDVEARVREISQSSVTFSVSFLHEQQVLAQVTIVAVCIEKESRSKAAVPDDLRKRLASMS